MWDVSELNVTFSGSIISGASGLSFLDSSLVCSNALDSFNSVGVGLAFLWQQDTIVDRYAILPGLESPRGPAIGLSGPPFSHLVMDGSTEIYIK